QQSRRDQVALDREIVQQTEEAVQVSAGDLEAAAAEIQSARAGVLRVRADVGRWESEVRRLGRMVTDRVVDQQVLTESERQLQSNQAGLAKAQADVKTAEAKQVAAAASLGKSRVDVLVARARVTVSEAELVRVTDLVGYTRIVAPYDGIVVVRNVNTGDFVLPMSESTAPMARSAVPSGGPAPLYLVARTDIVRIFVDVPEIDASYVVRGTKATVRIQALDDLDLSSGVTRTSWALNVKSRTLRAEIDLRNPDARLVPGMYAYGNVLIERPKARVLPRAAIVEQGNQQVCFLYQNGKVSRTPVQFGVSDGTWVEMLKKRAIDTWAEFDGLEQVALGDLIYLTDGQTVRVESEQLTRSSNDSPKVDSPR
ncbi:MAG TPA: efflux RND transporter periplasmic adaptor subunit, partial [Isosphaeraceae bacterium]|nr:efflux RND transporter periplasmic adaptor subunit [Isosphaeraceae bacterium]